MVDNPNKRTTNVRTFGKYGNTLANAFDTISIPSIFPGINDA